jgi:hypothetical protein
VRQGDVLLVPIDAIPDHARYEELTLGRLVLAHGEVTGHAHAISDAGAAIRAMAGERYLQVERPVSLRHEEHAAITVPTGFYRIVIQREFDPTVRRSGETSWRKVVD